MNESCLPAFEPTRDPLSTYLSPEHFYEANGEFNALEEKFNKREGLFSLKNSVNYKSFLMLAGAFVLINMTGLLLLFINFGASMLLGLYFVFVLTLIMVFVLVLMVWVIMDKTEYNHAQRNRFFKSKANYELCKKHNWYYGQKVPTERQTMIISKYNSFFKELSEERVNKGFFGPGHSLKNEIWGIQKCNNTVLPFYKADLSLVVKEHKGKYKESKLLLAFKLSAPVSELLNSFNTLVRHLS